MSAAPLPLPQRLGPRDDSVGLRSRCAFHYRGANSPDVAPVCLTRRQFRDCSGSSASTAAVPLIRKQFPRHESSSPGTDVCAAPDEVTSRDVTPIPLGIERIPASRIFFPLIHRRFPRRSIISARSNVTPARTKIGAAALSARSARLTLVSLAEAWFP